MNKLNKINQIRETLRNGKYSIGSWIQIPHSSIAEILGQAGYDWVAVDLEHGSISPHELPDLFRALELGNTLPLARLAQGKLKDCKQALDAGAAGLIIPMIESAKQLKEIIDFLLGLQLEVEELLFQEPILAKIFKTILKSLKVLLLLL